MPPIDMLTRTRRYKWSAPAASAASSEITLNGAAGDVFIFLFNT